MRPVFKDDGMRMRQSITRSRNSLTFSLWLTVLGGGNWVGSPVHAQQPTPKVAASPSSAVEERLRRLEEVNARLLERLDRDRDESAQRYRAVGGALSATPTPTGRASPRSHSHFHSRG